MKMWILVFLLFLVVLACQPPKQFEAPIVFHTDRNGNVISVDWPSDTLEIDLKKVRHIKIRGRVYDLPTDQQCERAEEDSVFTTQLTIE